MFLDHVDSFSKFLKFFVRKYCLPLLNKGPKHCFCRFLKNTVLCEFSLLKLFNIYILYIFLLLFKLWQKPLCQKATKVPNYEGAPSLNVKSLRKF